MNLPIIRNEKYNKNPEAYTNSDDHNDLTKIKGIELE